MRKKLNVIAMGVLANVMMASALMSSAAQAQPTAQLTLWRSEINTLWMRLDFSENTDSMTGVAIAVKNSITAKNLVFSGFSPNLSAIFCYNLDAYISCTFGGVYDQPSAVDSAQGYIEISLSGTISALSGETYQVVGGEPLKWTVPPLPEPEPPVLMQMAQYMDVTEGQDIDYQLRWHPMFPIPAETILNFEIAPADAKHPTGLGHEARLPAGLSMSANGRLTGTLSEAATQTGEPFWLFLMSTAADYTENTHVIPLGFRIVAATPPEPEPEPEPPVTGGAEKSKIIFRMTSYQK